MALFNRLLKLHRGIVPLEDFLTEIIAHLFEVQPEFLEAWLRHISAIQLGDSFISNVSTQQQYEALEIGSSGSRLDMQIDLSNDQQNILIFIESKVGSVESLGQLRRYAKILNSFYNIHQKLLIYITRDFEKKDPDEILRDLDRSVKFEQLRWQPSEQDNESDI